MILICSEWFCIFWICFWMFATFSAPGDVPFDGPRGHKRIKNSLFLSPLVLSTLPVDLPVKLRSTPTDGRMPSWSRGWCCVPHRRQRITWSSSQGFAAIRGALPPATLMFHGNVPVHIRYWGSQMIWFFLMWSSPSRKMESHLHTAIVAIFQYSPLRSIRHPIAIPLLTNRQYYTIQKCCSLSPLLNKF